MNKFVLPNLEDQYALRSLDWLASTVSPVPVLATIAAKGGGFIAQVKTRPDVELLTVTKGSRDGLPEGIAARLLL